ncbi:glycosyltransferase family 4 protein [Mycobacterium stomatepiae]|uniref:Glycosyl transferase family 1 n=1 Tax=Mycobacterium stomatepiae TaxID=470076 RepID=A0A7I7Q718_9MYCO|nr:glycosyltransferase family 4 protein [Mycobacterium stomatepiae]MCV7162999.1 glycosyltransferase family 4 protein [Mycobacterium stomatepiae]BBY22134.1 glycosyl transferase family 1 [Mycobacterium stomatepiae]
MNDALRIALVASNRFSISQPFAGGLEAHVWHLARALVQDGHEVALFAAAGSDEDLGCRTIEVRNLDVSEAAQADVSMPPAAFMVDHHAYLALMLQLAGCASGDFDIIHNHSLHYLPVAMAPILCTPMLTTVHTPPTPWLESAINASGGVGTRFAAVSRHTAAAWRTAVNSISVVPNGIATHQWPLGPGGGPLVWFGRMTAEKAPHLAIAVAKRASMPLVLAGPVSDPHYFATEVTPHFGDGIQYAGHLDQASLAQLVGRASAALITPMWDEPYGLVVAEAMCCGTPVVAFDRGGIPELVGLRSGRLVAPGDLDAMADAIPVVRQLSRKQLRENAVRHCSAQVMVRAYLDLYEDMLRDHDKGNNDRLLHSSSRFRALGAGGECLRAITAPSHGAEFARDSATSSVRRSREATE